MNKISTFTYKEKDIEVLYAKGNLAYTFEKDGKQYGYKVSLAKKDVISIASAAWVLLQNAIETIEALNTK